MATSAPSLEERLGAGALSIAVGGVFAISLLVTVDVIQHNGVSYLSADPVGWALTTVPLFVGWLFTAPLLGAYSPGTAESAESVVLLGTRSWLAATIVGMAIRWTPLFEGGVELVLVAVMLMLGPIALGVWRTLYFKLV